MKYILLIFICFALTVQAQKEADVAYNGYKGNYIQNVFKPASPAHPDGNVVGFRLERKALNETNWQVLQEFSTPSTYVKLKSNYEAAKKNVFEFRPQTAYSMEEIWPVFKKSYNFDNMQAYVSHQTVALAFHLLLLDSTASKTTSYQYRVVQMKSDKTEGQKYTTTAVSMSSFLNVNKPRPIARQTTGNSFRLKWGAKTTGQIPQALLIKRSDGIDQPFNRITPFYTIEQKKDSLFYEVIDEYVQSDMLYQYSITPVNRFGGGGKVISDTLHSALSDKNYLIPKLFTALEDTSISAIVLQWGFIKPDMIGVVKVFRSEEYEQGYQFIGTSDARTAFVDKQIVIGKKYYYFLNITDRLGRQSERSTKLFGLVQSSKTPDAPVYIEAKRTDKGNIISWQDFNESTRGFYVYRTSSVAGELKQLSEFIYKKEKYQTAFSYTDSEKLNGTKGYAIVSENLSNVHSLFSKTVYINGEIAKTSPPEWIDYTKMESGFRLFWKNENRNPIAGFNLYKKIGKEDFKKINVVPLNSASNSYFDSSATNQMTIVYKMASINTAGQESDFSTELTVSNTEIIYPPNSLKLFTTEDSRGVILEWQPSQSAVKKYEVYRYIRNQEPSKITEIEESKTTFTDKNFITNKTNYYFIIAVGQNGLKSLPSDETYKVMK